MFSWFKKGRKKSLIQANWNIDEISGFEKIQNVDSLQYVNEDASRIIYLSVLTVSGNGILQAYGNASGATVIADDNRWQVKGTKHSKNLILVCVISVIHEKDIDWATMFFESIEPY